MRLLELAMAAVPLVACELTDTLCPFKQDGISKGLRKEECKPDQGRSTNPQEFPNRPAPGFSLGGESTNGWSPLIPGNQPRSLRVGTEIGSLQDWTADSAHGPEPNHIWHLVERKATRQKIGQP